MIRYGIVVHTYGSLLTIVDPPKRIILTAFTAAVVSESFDSLVWGTLQISDSREEVIERLGTVKNVWGTVYLGIVIHFGVSIFSNFYFYYVKIVTPRQL